MPVDEYDIHFDSTEEEEDFRHSHWWQQWGGRLSLGFACCLVVLVFLACFALLMRMASLSSKESASAAVKLPGKGSWNIFAAEPFVGTAAALQVQPQTTYASSPWPAALTAAYEVVTARGERIHHR